MKKFSMFMALLAFGIFTSQSSIAAVSDAKTAGAAIVLDATTNVPGSSVINFNPSAQVSISVSSDTTAFAVAGGHDAVQGKDQGQNYGMASDSSNVFWSNAGTTAYATVSASNSSAFSGWNK